LGWKLARELDGLVVNLHALTVAVDAVEVEALSTDGAGQLLGWLCGGCTIRGLRCVLLSAIFTARALLRCGCVSMYTLTFAIPLRRCWLAYAMHTHGCSLLLSLRYCLSETWRNACTTLLQLTRLRGEMHVWCLLNAVQSSKQGRRMCHLLHHLLLLHLQGASQILLMHSSMVSVVSMIMMSRGRLLLRLQSLWCRRGRARHPPMSIRVVRPYSRSTRHPLAFDQQMHDIVRLRWIALGIQGIGQCLLIVD
jgi:hypothetical protein